MAFPQSAPELPRESEQSDQDLLGRVRAGETTWFAVLVRRYNRRLFRVARSITRDDDEAEDVVQQAFLSAFERLASFEGRAKFSTWLTRIAVNEALAQVRRRRPHAPLAALGGEAESSGATAAPGPEEVASLREISRLLERAIDTLPESYRTVYMMREVEEMRTAETAEALGISPEAVRVRLFRARAALREELLARAGVAVADVFAFAGERCDRIVARVFTELERRGIPIRRERLSRR